MKFFAFNSLITLFLIIILLVLPYNGNAQPGDDFIDPDAEIPIDGGLSLLIAAGVGYGVKKANDFRKKNKCIDLLNH